VLRLLDARPLVFALLGVSCGGTIDPGEDFQFAEVVYDQNYFYCKVEPMLMDPQQSCGPGKSGTDAPNGCHENVTPFRLTPHPPIACNGIIPTGNVPPAAQSNYEAAAREMAIEPDSAPLLNRPTRRAAHPRQIFDLKSAQADLIRNWATKYTSQ